MSDDGTPVQYWVRTEDGRLMGPLTFVTIELLASEGAFGQSCEVSLDGILFAPPGEMAAVREAFPRALWGTGTLEPTAPYPPGGPDTSVFDLPPLVESPEAPVAPLDAPPPGFVPPQTRFQPIPAGTRVHAAPLGERVQAAPAGEARAHTAPAGVQARKERETVSEGVPLPELIAEGKLFGGTVLRLYYLVAAGKHTGRLTLTQGDNAGFEIFFKKGQPEQVVAADTRLSLSSHLVRMGKLPAEKALEAEAARGRFGGQVVNALFAMGLIDPAEAFALIGDHARGLLRQALQVDGGTFAWDASAAMPNGTLPLGSALALLGAAGRTIDAAVAFGRLAGRIDCPVMRAGDGLAQVEELALTAVESRALAAFDGTRSLAEIATSTGDAELVYRLGWFLGEVGFASFARAVRPRPENAPMLGEAPPIPGQEVMDPELEAAQAPMPPPGFVMPPGLDAVAPFPPALAPFQDGPPVVAPRASPVIPRAAPKPPPVERPPPVAPARLDPTPGPFAARREGTPGPPPRREGTPGPPPRREGTPGPPPRREGTPGPPPRREGTPGPPPRSNLTPGPPAPRLDPTPGPFGGRPPPPPRPGAPAPPNSVPALQKLVTRMKDQDHFQLLGVQRGATSAQVKAAYFKMAREHHPDTAGSDAGADVQALKADITARLNEAYQEIGEDGPRARYIARLAAGVKSNEVDLSAILAAEEAFNMGAILVKARKFAEALPELEKSIDLNPKEGEFYAWRGFARFFAVQDKWSVEADALADLKKALSLNERCAAAYLFAGRIATALGNGTEAARQYRSCLGLDPKNVEAQRELRLLESRAAK